jgi:hypothetical protein
MHSRIGILLPAVFAVQHRLDHAAIFGDIQRQPVAFRGRGIDLGRARRVVVRNLDGALHGPRSHFLASGPAAQGLRVLLEDLIDAGLRQ